MRLIVVLPVPGVWAGVTNRQGEGTADLSPSFSQVVPEQLFLKFEPTNLILSKCNENENTFRPVRSLNFGNNVSLDELLHGYIRYSRDYGSRLWFWIISAEKSDGLVLSVVKAKSRPVVPTLTLRSA